MKISTFRIRGRRRAKLAAVALGLAACLLAPGAASAFDTGPHFDMTRDVLTSEGFGDALRCQIIGCRPDSPGYKQYIRTLQCLANRADDPAFVIPDRRLKVAVDAEFGQFLRKELTVGIQDLPEQ